MRTAASVCLVASGLFMAGAGGAIALAEPEPGYGKSDDRQSSDSLGETIRRALGIDGGNDQKASEPGNRPDSRWGNGRIETQVPGEKEPPRGEQATETTKPATPPTQTTKPAPTPCPEPKRCPEPTTPPGEPPGRPVPSQSGGGGGGAIEQLPRFRQPEIPTMQLPDELQPGEPAAPGGPAVIDAGAGAVAATAPIGTAPIVLPVIVAPPISLGGAGGAGPAGTPPGAPRAVTAEPAAGRVPPPANVGSNAAVPASSYRIGYTEYLRSAGLPQVAALAVPGLAGILVLTGAGGLVGYRQAKAGHAVRTGTARFMR